MIKSTLLLFISLTLTFAQSNNKQISKFEIRDGKKVYFPIKKEPLSAIVSNQIVKSDIKTPVIKGFYIDYKKN